MPEMDLAAQKAGSYASAHAKCGQGGDIKKSRAVIRFMKFLCITLFYVVRVIEFRFMKSAPAGAPQLDCTPFVRRWAREVNRVLGIEVTLRGNVPDEGALLISNHRSYADVTVIGQFVPVTFLAKREVSQWPIIGSGCRLVDVVFVDRKSPESRNESRFEVAERLRNNISIVVFPEGTSYQGPDLLAFRPGIFRMAALRGYPVVPVAVRYDDPADAWVGEDMFVPHFMRTFAKRVTGVEVTFGPVLRNRDPEKLMNSSWQWIYGILMKSL